MLIQQLSIFLENKPGHLSKAIGVLAAQGINIVTLSLADTEQFGILRLIVRDEERAQKMLQDAGFMVKITEVLAIEVADRAGGLAEILQLIEQHQLNIEYMYAYTTHHAAAAVLIFRFNDTEAAVRALQNQTAINVVKRENLMQTFVAKR